VWREAARDLVPFYRPERRWRGEEAVAASMANGERPLMSSVSGRGTEGVTPFIGGRR
jgi:hypothetical protein